MDHQAFQILVLLMTLLLTACGQKPVTNQEMSSTPLAERDGDSSRTFVRVFNALPNIEVDVFVDENKVFAKVPYVSLTPYRELPGGQTITFLVRRSGQTGKPLVQKKETISQGHRYTVVALPGSTREDPAIAVLSDNSNPAPVTQVRLRFINASPSIGEADLYSSGKELLFENVQFESETGYGNFPPPHGLEVRAEDDTRVARMSNAHLHRGSIYTVIIVGQSPELHALALEDQDPFSLEISHDSRNVASRN
jgi:hypothetical protein